jgi:hypothetical protein
MSPPRRSGTTRQRQRDSYPKAESIFAEEAPGHFGWMAMFAGLDMPCSSALTQEHLGWKPTGPKLIYDLDRAKVFESVSI